MRRCGTDPPLPLLARSGSATKSAQRFRYSFVAKAVRGGSFRTRIPSKARAERQPSRASMPPVRSSAPSLYSIAEATHRESASLDAAHVVAVRSVRTTVIGEEFGLVVGVADVDVGLTAFVLEGDVPSRVLAQVIAPLVVLEVLSRSLAEDDDLRVHLLDPTRRHA